MNDDNGKEKDMEDGKVTARDVYERLWVCRDFELSTLWQRSAMLGAFMLATYAGYGALMLKAFDGVGEAKWELFNLLAVGTCCFGMVFSAMWAMMLKGSKRWCETCEAALHAFQEENGGAFSGKALDWVAFKAFYSDATKRRLRKVYEVDNGLFSAHGGRYSVSRVAIAIGQVSLGGWIVLAILHVAALMAEFAEVRGLLRQPEAVVSAALVLFVGCVWLVFYALREHVESNSLP